MEPLASGSVGSTTERRKFVPDGGRRSRDDDSVSAPTVVNRMGDLSAKPVVVLVDDEDASRQALARVMEDRYGAHYRIRSSASQEEALAALQQLRDGDVAVPLVLADQWMPGGTGAQFLARVRELPSTARRGLLISWGDQSALRRSSRRRRLGRSTSTCPSQPGRRMNS